MAPGLRLSAFNYYYINLKYMVAPSLRQGADSFTWRLVRTYLLPGLKPGVFNYNINSKYVAAPSLRTGADSFTYLRPGGFNYYVNSKHVMASGLRPSADSFTYSHLASGRVGFIIFIPLLCKFKAYEGTQMRKMLLLHSELLWVFITLSMNLMYVNFVNCIDWFNPAYSGAARRPRIKSLFSSLSLFLPLSSPSFDPYSFSPHLLIYHLQSRRLQIPPQGQPHRNVCWGSVWGTRVCTLYQPVKGGSAYNEWR